MLIYLCGRYSKITHRGFDNFQTSITPTNISSEILENRPAESDKGGGAYLDLHKQTLHHQGGLSLHVSWTIFGQQGSNLQQHLTIS